MAAPRAATLTLEGDECLAAADRGPHWLAESGMDRGRAVLHLARCADNGGFAIADGRAIELRDGFRHQSLPQCCASFEQRGQVGGMTLAGERVPDHGKSDDADDRRAGLAGLVRLRCFAEEQGFADFHRVRLVYAQRALSALSSAVSRVVVKTVVQSQRS